MPLKCEVCAKFASPKTAQIIESKITCKYCVQKMTGNGSISPEKVKQNCCICGVDLGPNSVYRDDELNTYCWNCYMSHTIECEICGRREHKDKVSKWEGVEGWVCTKCASKYKYTCTFCGNSYINEIKTPFMIDGKSVCPHCRSKFQTNCCTCGSRIIRIETKRLDNGYYCEKCFDYKVKNSKVCTTCGKLHSGTDEERNSRCPTIINYPIPIPEETPDKGKRHPLFNLYEKVRNFSVGRLNIQQEMLNFYLLSSMVANEAINLDTRKHTNIYWAEHSRLQEAFETVKVDLANKLYPYLFHAVAGELRYGRRGILLPDWVVTSKEYVLDKYNQRRAYQEGTILNAQRLGLTQLEFAEQAIVAFQSWPIWGTKDAGYGGKNWSKIAKAIVLFHRMPLDVWIDHVFDLEHNNGGIFDKRTDVFVYNKQICKYILESKKFNNSPYQILWNIPVSYLNVIGRLKKQTYKYLVWGANIGLWEKIEELVFKNEMVIGKKPMKENQKPLIESDIHDYEDEDDEEEEEYFEQEQEQKESMDEKPAPTPATEEVQTYIRNKGEEAGTYWSKQEAAD